MNFDSICDKCGGLGQFELQSETGFTQFEDCLCRWESKGSSIYSPSKSTMFICKHCNKPHDRLQQLECAVGRVEIELSERLKISVKELRTKRVFRKV